MGGRRGGPRAGDAGRLVLLRCAIQLKRPSRDRFGGVSFSLSLQLGGSAAFEDLSARTAAAPRRTGRTARGGGGLVASVCPFVRFIITVLVVLIFLGLFGGGGSSWRPR